MCGPPAKNWGQVKPVKCSRRSDATRLHILLKVVILADAIAAVPVSSCDAAREYIRDMSASRGGRVVRSADLASNEEATDSEASFLKPPIEKHRETDLER